MRRLLLLLLCSSSVLLHAQSTPPWLWSSYLTGNLGAYINSAKTDAQGNTYTIGTDDYSNTTNIYVTKSNAAGRLIWYNTISGSVQCNGTALGIDTSGDVIISGSFDGTALTLYSVAPATNSVTLTGPSPGSIFIAKYTTAGALLWAKTLPCTGNYYGTFISSIATDAAGDLYLSGAYSGSLSFGSTTISTTTPQACCFAKLDANGNALWAQTLNGTGNIVQGDRVAVDAQGDVYLLGHFESNTLTIGTSTFTNHGVADIFLAKYTATGSYTWAKSIGGSNIDLPDDMAIDKNDNPLITGFICDTVAFGSHTITCTSSYGWMFAAKYDPLGNNLWAVANGGSADVSGQAISTDTAANVFVAGFFRGRTLIFAHDTLVNDDTISNTHDIFISKYDPSGNIQWAKHLGASMDDVPSCLGNDLSGNIYLSASFGGASIIIGDTQLVNTGPYPTTVQAVFLSKLAPYICSYALPYDTLTVPATAGRDTVPVITQTGCDWSASVVSGSSWIFVTASGRAGSSMYVTTSSNTADTTRMGIVMVDSIPLVIVQPGNPATCTFTATPDTFYTISFDAAVYSDIAVITTEKGCVWTDTVIVGSNWLSTTSTGINGDSVSVTLDANSSLYPRTSKIGLGNNSFMYVVQAGNPGSITSVSGDNLTVYPNPASGIFYVKGATAGNTIQVFDMLGQCVYTGIISGAVQAVTLGKEATGIYTYRISDNNNSIRQGKITIQ